MPVRRSRPPSATKALRRARLAPMATPRRRWHSPTRTPPPCRPRYSFTSMTTLICDCSRTMPLDAAALSRALGPEAGEGLGTVHSVLCRREAGAFQRAAKGGSDLLVACTQESRLFVELAEATEGVPRQAERPIRFVNIRQTGGWSKDAPSALPKMAALLAVAQLPEAEPVPTVSYASAGRVLVVGTADRALRAAAMLHDKLQVTVLLPRPGGTLPQAHTLPV